MLLQWLPRIIFFIVAIPAIVFHEVAHGYVANLLGDPTAKRAGRLSLNPVRHVDPFGTILLPALLALAKLPVFGYAKPVPINPYFFKDYRKGMLLTGLAGPGTNLAMAAAVAVVARGIDLVFHPGIDLTQPLTWLMVLLASFVEINLFLMFFNLIPVPPFDGSRVIPIFLSDEAMRVYGQIERYGFIIILALLYFGGPIISRYFAVTVDPLLQFLLGDAVKYAL